MTNIDLSQSEAEGLLQMEKVKANDDVNEYPALGGDLSIPLQSRDRRESFILDVWRSGRIELKGRYQNRARQVVVLARLDFGGAPHRNPDDSEIPCPHLHHYREGFGDKWAVPLPSSHFPRPNDLWGTLEDFMRYCNIIDPPKFTSELFA